MDIAAAIASAGLSRMDAEVLLAYILHCDRAHILSHPELVLLAEQQRQWEECAKRRRGGEPVAYITGEREFYGRMFHVDRRVHIPRPSTENLVTMTLDFLRNPKDEVRELETGIVGVARTLRPSHHVNTIVDVCTGSGCIAVTLALERPDLDVLALDISEDALQVAEHNARRLGADRVRCMQSDLLAGLPNDIGDFVIVSNPPYLSKAMIAVQPDIQWEPHIALDGGKDGSELLCKLFQQTCNHPRCCGIVMEFLGTTTHLLSDA